MFYYRSIVRGQVDLSTLTELGRPSGCSSPGWRNAPYDISTLIGSYVNFNCRSSIPHSQTLWLYNGKEMNMPRGTISRDNSTLRYGPITDSDSNVAIGCEVMTHFGVIPSPQGKIAVMGKCNSWVQQLGLILQLFTISVYCVCIFQHICYHKDYFFVHIDYRMYLGLPMQAVLATLLSSCKWLMLGHLLNWTWTTQVKHRQQSSIGSRTARFLEEMGSVLQPVTQALCSHGCYQEMLGNTWSGPAQPMLAALRPQPH